MDAGPCACGATSRRRPVLGARSACRQCPPKPGLGSIRTLAWVPYRSDLAPFWTQSWPESWPSSFKFRVLQVKSQEIGSHAIVVFGAEQFQN